MTRLKRVKDVVKKGLKFFVKNKKSEDQEKTDPNFHRMLHHHIDDGIRKRHKKNHSPRKKKPKPAFD